MRLRVYGEGLQIGYKKLIAVRKMDKAGVLERAWPNLPGILFDAVIGQLSRLNGIDTGLAGIERQIKI